jgi:hypothetical protein
MLRERNKRIDGAHDLRNCPNPTVHPFDTTHTERRHAGSFSDYSDPASPAEQANRNHPTTIGAKQLSCQPD